MSFASLGLRLHDINHDTDLHRAFASWWDYARVHYMPQRDGQMLGPMSMYYDPIIDTHHHSNLQGPTKLSASLALVPQVRDAARVLVESSYSDMGWPHGALEYRPGDNPTPILNGLFVAREFGDEALYAKLKAHCEAHHEPTWDQRTGEFTFGFGLDEPYPRGQYNGAAAMAEATHKGAWWRLFNEPNLHKFIDPTVYGVDFPTVALSQATYDAQRQVLVIATDTGLPDAAGQQTTFRVTNVNPGRCSVEVDGVRSKTWREVDGDIEIETTVGAHRFLIRENH